MNDDAALLFKFENQSINPATFSHREHLQVAYEMLKIYDYATATKTYANTIDAIARKAGASDKFNMTITVAFMSIIAERASTSEHNRFDEFISSNQDLLSMKPVLQRYSAPRLMSELARSVFLLPDQLPPADSDGK